MIISAVVLTKNEERNIAACLSSLSWTDEILVVDDNSTDKTVAIAKQHKARVISHALNYDFSKQRNFGLEKATGDWILFVDADERISEALRDEIIQYTNNPINKYRGYFVKREDNMWGKILRHGEQGNVQLLRLAKKGAGTWVGKVHEVWNVAGPVGVLTSPIHHFPHPTLAEFLQEINFYSTIRAHELHEKGISVHWLDVILYPKAKFVQDYFLRLGFLDGTAGFVVAMLMSLHSFLVKGKLWQLTKK